MVGVKRRASGTDEWTGEGESKERNAGGKGVSRAKKVRGALSSWESARRRKGKRHVRKKGGRRGEQEKKGLLHGKPESSQKIQVKEGGEEKKD